MEDLKKMAEIIFKAFPLTYLLGYFVICGYLSGYNFSEYNLLNLTFLKAGIVVSVFISCFVIAIYFCFSTETMTDNYHKSWPSLLAACFIVHLILFLFTLQMPGPGLFTGSKKINYIVTILIFLLMLFLQWTSNKTARNNAGLIFKLGIPLLLLIILIAIRAYYNGLIGTLWLFVIAIFIKSIISLGEIGDKEYTMQAVFDFIVILIICYLFGKYIYGEIPANFAGGKPYEIAIRKKNDNILYDSTVGKLDTFKVIYENADNLLLKDKKGQVFNTQKSELKTILVLEVGK